MSEAVAYTTGLLLELFSEDEQKLLRKFSKLILQDKPDLTEIWEYDKKLGGLGGYAMPSNPTRNPFNTWGKDRNLFRSVQYAKSGFVYYPHIPRNMIVDAGRSLEWTCKYMLDHYSVISRIKNHEMLGKSLERLHKKQIIDQELYEQCKLLGAMHNAAKHKISDDQDRTFSTLDGVVAYFALRKIHNKLLSVILHESLGREYVIYNDMV